MRSTYIGTMNVSLSYVLSNGACTDMRGGGELNVYCTLQYVDAKCSFLFLRYCVPGTRMKCTLCRGRSTLDVHAPRSATRNVLKAINIKMMILPFFHQFSIMIHAAYIPCPLPKQCEVFPDLTSTLSVDHVTLRPSTYLVPEVFVFIVSTPG